MNLRHFKIYLALSVLFLGYSALANSVEVETEIERRDVTPDIRGNPEPDWSPFLLNEPVNLSAAVECVHDLPVHNYWDLSKGAYRTGVIGDILLKHMPQYAVSMERKSSKGKSSSSGAQMVDLTLIFTKFISAVQYMATSLDSLECSLARIQPLASLHKIDSKITFQIFEESSLPSLSVKISTLNIKRELLNISLEYLISSIDRSKSLHELRASKLKSFLNEVHNSIVNTSLAHYNTSSEVNLEQFKSLLALAHIGESKRFNETAFELRHKHELEVALLEGEVTASLLAIEFRAAQLLRMMEEKYRADKEILRMRSSIAITKVENTIAAIVSELVKLADVFWSEPKQSILFVTIGAASLLGVVFIFELTTIVNAFFQRAFIKGKPLGSTEVNKRKLRGDRSVELIMKPDTEVKVISIIERLRCASTHKLSVPTVLISGPPGTGKTSICEFITRSVKDIEFIHISGGDLQSMGSRSGLFLRHIFQSRNTTSKWNSLPTVIILEEADNIIANRREQFLDEIQEDGAKQTDLVSQCCFYNLLTGLPDLMANVSVIAISRLKMKQIDDAVKNRVEEVITLFAPNGLERLEFALSSFQTLMDMLSPTEREILSDLRSRSASSVLEAVIRATYDKNSIVCAIPNESVGIPESVQSPFWCDLQYNLDEGVKVNIHIIRQLQLEENIHSNTDFEPLLCLKAYLLLSEERTFRDLHQFFCSLRYSLSSRESEFLTCRSWVKEGLNMFNSFR